MLAANTSAHQTIWGTRQRLIASHAPRIVNARIGMPSSAVNDTRTGVGLPVLDHPRTIGRRYSTYTAPATATATAFLIGTSIATCPSRNSSADAPNASPKTTSVMLCDRTASAVRTAIAV